MVPVLVISDAGPQLPTAALHGDHYRIAARGLWNIVIAGERDAVVRRILDIPSDLDLLQRNRLAPQ